MDEEAQKVTVEPGSLAHTCSLDCFTLYVVSTGLYGNPIGEASLLLIRTRTWRLREAMPLAQCCTAGQREFLSNLPDLRVCVLNAGSQTQGLGHHTHSEAAGVDR